MELNLAPPSAAPRILHVVTSLTTGGVEVMLRLLLSATRSHYQQGVVSMKDEGTVGAQIRELGIPVHCLRLSRTGLNQFRALSIVPLLRRFRPDLIVGWMYHGNLIATLAGGRTSRAPVIWGIHYSLGGLHDDGWRTSSLIHLGARFSRCATRIIYASQVSRKQHEALGYNPSTGLVIPNGIDDTVFAPTVDARRAVRTELGVPEDAVLVGLVARYHPMKDQAGFLRAAALVLAADPSTRFVLIGRGVPEQSDILKLITDFGIRDRVILLGERTDTPSLTAGLDIACSASAWGEACSLAIGEAMASGVPCVVTDVGDNARLVGDTGLSVPPRKPEALAQAICHLVSAGPAYRQQLGRSARLRIQEHYSLAAVVNRYKDVYRECLQRSGDRVI